MTRRELRSELAAIRAAGRKLSTILKRGPADPMELKFAAAAFLQTVFEWPELKEDFDRRSELVETAWGSARQAKIRRAALCVLRKWLPSAEEDAQNGAEFLIAGAPRLLLQRWRGQIVDSPTGVILSSEVKKIFEALNELLQHAFQERTRDIRALTQSTLNPFESNNLDLKDPTQFEKEREELSFLIKQFEESGEPADWEIVRCWRRELEDLYVVGIRSATDGCRFLAWVADGGEPGISALLAGASGGFLLSGESPFRSHLSAMRDAVKAIVSTAEAADTLGTAPSSVSSRGSCRRKPPGRKKANYDVQTHESRIAALWEDAKAAKVPKHEFAEQQNMSMEELTRLLDRDRKRKRPLE